MAKQVSNDVYDGFRKLLYDYGGFDPMLVVNCTAGPAYEHKLRNIRAINNYIRQHKGLYDLIANAEDKTDWGVFYGDWGHAALREEDWRSIYGIKKPSAEYKPTRTPTKPVERKPARMAAMA